MSDNLKDYSINSERWLSLENFEGEVWKDINGFEGFYKVSNYGRIKTVGRIVQCKGKNGSNSYVIVKEKIKKFADNGHGYYHVNLYKNNIRYQQYIHRLVALAFIKNPLNLPQVNHRDEDKSNNSVDNLEWCSSCYNNNYGTAKYRSKKTLRDNGNTTQIDMYDLDGNFIKHYDCAYDLEKDGISRRCVYNVCYGRVRSYKGCVFRFTGDLFSYRDIDSYKKGLKKQVRVKDKNGTLIKIYDSIKSAERDNNLSRNFLYSATYASTRAANINGLLFEIQTVY